MTAHGAPAPTSARRLRLVAATLAAAFLLSLGVSDAIPATATDWTRQIAGTRASQIYYESMMRGADHQLKSIKRTSKQTRRKLKSGKRNLQRSRARRSRLGERYRESRTRFITLKRDLASARTPAPEATTDIAGAIVVLSTLAPPRPGSFDEAGGSVLGGSGAGWLGWTQPTTPDAEVSSKDVTKARQQMKKQQRAFKKASQKSRRVARNTRARARSLASLKRQHRATIARRESAEAALGGRILAMSQLAQRRAMKKTRVRPGASGFTWPVHGRLTQGYGRSHDGIDIAGYRGAPIRAAAVGVVSYVGWNPWDKEGRAFMVVVAHPGGYETLYGHTLPTRRVKVGQLVRRGEVIGYMGNTGRSTGVHLHLEMRRGRTTVNPLAFL